MSLDHDVKYITEYSFLITVNLVPALGTSTVSRDTSL